MARTLRLSPSTITRELARFDAWTNQEAAAVAFVSDQYNARTAGLRARRARFKCRRCSKLAGYTVLFGVAQHFPRRSRANSNPSGPMNLNTLSHTKSSTPTSTLCPGELRKDLIACLRLAKDKRMPRSRGEDRRGHMSDLLSIHVRPPEVKEREIPDHWEGDLMKGSGNRSAAGMLVERSSRLVVLIKLADATGSSALEAFTAKLRCIAQPNSSIQ